jgi:hypothetical protein
MIDGEADGEVLGREEGDSEGIVLGMSEVLGREEGDSEGVALGMSDGLEDG